MTDAADHAWTMAVAKSSTPLPPHSPPLRHGGGGLNVAARHCNCGRQTLPLATEALVYRGRAG